VVELACLARAVAHRLAAVEDERHHEVGLFLELADIIPLGSAVDLPVDVPRVVAGHIGPMLCELTARAEVGASLEPGHGALDQVPGPHLQRCDMIEYVEHDVLAVGQSLFSSSGHSSVSATSNRLRWHTPPRRQNPNDEIRMTNEARNPNVEDTPRRDECINPDHSFSTFGVRHSFVIRASTFVIHWSLGLRHWSFLDLGLGGSQSAH